MYRFGVTYRGTVYPWQCDHMGHMNVMWYSGKFDEASWQFLAALGLTRSRLRKENTGMAALEQHITYKRELRAGDTVTIRSVVVEVKEKICRVMHEMQNDETCEIVATSTIVAAYMDAASRTAQPLPADVRDRAEAAVSCWEFVTSSSEARLEFSQHPTDAAEFSAASESQAAS